MLCLVGHSTQNKKTHLMPVKPLTILCFVYVKPSSTLLIFLFYLTLTCIFTSLMPLSHLALLSRVELLSLSFCHWGKQNTVAMETAHREARGSLWEFQCRDRSLYKAISCLCAERWLQRLWTLCLSFPCEKHRWGDRDWGTEKVTWKDWKKERWLILIRQKMSCYC